MKARLGAVFAVFGSVLAVLAVGRAVAQGYGPPSPTSDPMTRLIAAQRTASRGTSDVDLRRVDDAVAKLLPQRPGTADAYVIVAALDSDPVFGREARETARVLSRRYDAAGRTLLLAGADGRGIDPLPGGSPETLGAAIARVGAMMDPAEDALILYITAHGSPAGVAYRDHGQVLGTVSPEWLELALRRARVHNRIVIVSACYSGVFVPVLASPEGAVITAASAEHTSFGCQSDNDWTFFGDALINHGFRKSQPLAAAFGEARGLVSSWEMRGKLIPSDPQISIGARTATWLRPLELRTPKDTTMPVGRPAIAAIDKAIAANH